MYITYIQLLLHMYVDHVHCWSPGRMAIWGCFLVQGWGPFCDADPPRGSTLLFWAGDGQTSREWAPDTQGDPCRGLVAACATIPCRTGNLEIEKKPLSAHSVFTDEAAVGILAFSFEINSLLYELLQRGWLPMCYQAKASGFFIVSNLCSTSTVPQFSPTKQ